MAKATSFDPGSYGDGKGGPFDFSRQGALLSLSLSAAVPLWIAELVDLRQRSPDLFVEQIKRWTQEGAQVLGEHGDALMFEVKNKSAEAFNHLARGIACLSFCPGGVTVFGSHWETL